MLYRLLSATLLANPKVSIVLVSHYIRNFLSPGFLMYKLPRSAYIAPREADFSYLNTDSGDLTQAASQRNP